MNIELLKDAIAIIDGIPAPRIVLDRWQSSGCVSDGWGGTKYRVVRHIRSIKPYTVACAAVWLSLHPQFRALKVRILSSSGEPYIPHKSLYGYGALAHLFDITPAMAAALFESRSVPERIRYSELDDKSLWLRRARVLLTDREGFISEFCTYAETRATIII